LFISFSNLVSGWVVQRAWVAIVAGEFAEVAPGFSLGAPDDEIDSWTADLVTVAVRSGPVNDVYLAAQRLAAAIVLVTQPDSAGR
jgi:hypothetical protein